MEYLPLKKRALIEDWNIAFLRVSIPWIVGLLLGGIIAYHMSDFHLQLVRLFVNSKMSFLGLLVSSLLPFLIAAFIARYVGRGWLQTYLFMKSAFFSLSFCYCSRCFGSSGWLVATLLFCTDLISSYCLLLFSYKLLKSQQGTRQLFFVPHSVISTLFGLFNYFVISPFTASLF